MTPRVQAHSGVLLLALAAICWSTAGLFTRLIPLDPWTILFWRGVFGAVLTGACMLVAGGGTLVMPLRFRRAHGSILLWMTLGTLAYIPALALTSVASVAIVHATTPLIVAGLSRVWLAEQLRPVTVAAGLIAVGGVALMGSDRATDVSGAGLSLALAMAFCMAMTMVAFRKHPDASCWPIGCLSNALTALVTMFLARPFAVAPVNLAYLLLFGLVQMTLGLGLFALGTRRLPAADGAIVGLLETPLAPFWVWLAFNERPSGWTMVGGALVLAAAAGHIAAARKRRTPGACASGGRTMAS
jgi:drug/metabolite transporter (DMT)-like permease